MTIGEKIQYLPFFGFAQILESRLAEIMDKDKISERFLEKVKVSNPKRMKVLLDLLAEYGCKMTAKHFYDNRFHLYLVNKKKVECRYCLDNQILNT